MSCKETSRNKIDTFPVDIRNEIDAMLLNNESIAEIVRFLKEKHNITIDRWTVSLYKRLFLKVDELENGTEVVSQEEISNIQIIENKKRLLEDRIAACTKRINEIQLMNRRRFDPKWESFIISYTDLIRKMIETLSKLKEDFDNDAEKINNIAKINLSKIMKCVYETVKSVCPDKLMVFKEVLSEKYKENVEQERIENGNK